MNKFRSMLVAAMAFTMLTACENVKYDEAKPGAFSGKVVVVWVGPNETGLGNRRFLYVPVRDKELQFDRTATSYKQSVKTISPEPFYTDGGSIPRIGQAFKGFSAWGYGPAYVIHDWIFVVQKCANEFELGDQNPLPKHKRNLNGMKFVESAQIMAETIKTLEETFDQNDVSPAAGPIISLVTAGKITRDLWEARTGCRDSLPLANDATTKELRELIADLRGGVDRADVNVLSRQNGIERLDRGVYLMPSGDITRVIAEFEF